MSTITKLSLVLSLLAGCTLGSLTPRARFQESAYTVNDASRWGQVDIASSYVTPAYQERFRDRRREWGERINVAEVEVLQMKLADDRDTGVSEVSLSWYDAGMTVHKSLITQRWENARGTFRLADEVVRKGDPGVFAD